MSPSDAADADAADDNNRADTNASASTSRLDLVVPAAGAMLVEFPGYVRNVPAAMQILGGEQALAAAAEGRAKYLTARLRPGDPLSHPLVSSALREEGKRRGLLLRVSRPTTTTTPTTAAAATATEEENNDGKEATTATATPTPTRTRTTVAAVVSTGVSFPGLADVQYAAWDARPPAEQVGRSLPSGVAVAASLSSLSASASASRSTSASAAARASASLAAPDPPGSILPGEPLLAVPPVFFASDVAPAPVSAPPPVAPASAPPAAKKKK